MSMGGPWRLGTAYLGKTESQGNAPLDFAAVSNARARGALVVITIHIDGPPSYLPSPSVRSQALSFLEAGASVVALHGSHVIGPIERHAHGIVAWGLGNLSFACPCSTEREGLILQVQAQSDKKIKAQLLPILTGNASTPIRQHPDPASIFELLSALESSPLSVHGAVARL